jgi:hypothetical protein
MMHFSLAGPSGTGKDIIKTHLTGCGLDSTGSQKNTAADSFEHANDPPVSIKSGEFR